MGALCSYQETREYQIFARKWRFQVQSVHHREHVVHFIQ